MTNQKVVIGKGDFRIEQLDGLYRELPSKISFNTEYQRSFIWKTAKKQLLIDSIMRDYDINKVFLRQLNDGGYECLDGQQRLRSIFDFIDTDTDKQFPMGECSKDLGLEGRTIEDLKDSYPQFYYKLIYYKIDAVVVYQADEETTSDIFLRLQEGMPLNSAEKLNAMRGILRNNVVEMSQHSFWHTIGVGKYRFAHRHLCAQMAALEIANVALPNEGLHICDLRFPTIQRNYRLYRSVDLPQKAVSDMGDTLNFLNRSLGSIAQLIKQRTDVIPIYLLASYLLKRYGSVRQNAAKFKDFIELFLTNVYGSHDSPYAEYKDARSKSTESRKSVNEGFKIILGKFLEFVPDLPLKDEKRLFDYGQRLAIYYRDGGQCQGSFHQGDRSLRFDEAELHHIKPWHEGGATVVSNGLLLCQQCHTKES